jgi:hypothetical protein
MTSMRNEGLMGFPLARFHPLIILTRGTQVPSISAFLAVACSACFFGFVLIHWLVNTVRYLVYVRRGLKSGNSVDAHNLAFVSVRVIILLEEHRGGATAQLDLVLLRVLLFEAAFEEDLRAPRQGDGGIYLICKGANLSTKAPIRLMALEMFCIQFLPRDAGPAC